MKNDVTKKILLANWGLFLLSGLFLTLLWKKLPPQLPWFYSLPIGDQQLVDKRWMAGSLLGGAVSIWVTSMMARWAGKNDATVETTLAIGFSVFNMLLLISVLKVVQIFAL